jgi:hypothetical protein
MRPIGLPKRRRTRILLLIGAAVAVYLLVLSVVPAMFGGESVEERRGRAQRVIAAENWGLVTPADRALLHRAVDEAWRGLTFYVMTYQNGLPAQVRDSSGGEWVASSMIRIENGRIVAQEDSSFISAASPGSGGRDERLEGFRIRAQRPYVDRRGKSILTELVYQRSVPGQWTCERVPADREPPPAPNLDFPQAGDAGFAEINQRRVRGFVLPHGGFGLRAQATVWVDVETLLVIRQEILESRQGRTEIWTYDGFGQPRAITPPEGIPCRDE